MIGFSDPVFSDPVLESPAFVSGLDDFTMMGKPVEKSGRHLRVAEDARPFPECQVGGDDDARSSQHILDHPQAERKPELEPNGMGNHLPWKSVATIKRIAGKSGHPTRSQILIDARLTLQCRYWLSVASGI